MIYGFTIQGQASFNVRGVTGRWHRPNEFSSRWHDWHGELRDAAAQSPVPGLLRAAIFIIGKRVYSRRVILRTYWLGEYEKNSTIFQPDRMNLDSDYDDLQSLVACLFRA